MKKIIALVLSLFALTALTLCVSAEMLNTTLVRDTSADPWMFRHDGKFYLTQTGATQVAVFESETLSGINDLYIYDYISYNSAEDPTVEALYGADAAINGTWSPEIHYFSEEDFPGNSGWYMFVGLRKTHTENDKINSRYVRLVVLKSTTDSPLGPYGHPTELTENHSQPLLDKDGNIVDEWGCGQTILRINEGEYAGLYAMWVAEEGRDSGVSGEFYQKIMIAKLETPWKLASEPAVMTTPTQEWEKSSGTSTLPEVVEGATPVYGRNGEIFIVYSGSGYWANYALGQLTWTGGNPLETASWVKLDESKNPIFNSTGTEYIDGAGHASFLTDIRGNGFAVYHGYPTTGDDTTHRDAFIEPYYIDYTEDNGAGKGVVHIGFNDNGEPADSATVFSFYHTTGSALEAPNVAVYTTTTSTTLTMNSNDADGFTIYRSDDGELFEYLVTATENRYTDSGLSHERTYYYRVYAYRAEEISSASEVRSVTPKTASPLVSSVEATYGEVKIIVEATDDYDKLDLYRSDDGSAYNCIDSVENVTSGEMVTFEDTVFEPGTYYYRASGTRFGYENGFVNEKSVTVTAPATPTVTSVSFSCKSLSVFLSGGEEADAYEIYRSTDGVNFYHIATTAEATYIDSDVTLGETYHYAATCVIGDFEGELSDAKSATVSHLETAGEALAPTCTEAGYTAYTYCSECDQVLLGKETVDALGHSYELTEEEVPATATSAGKTAVYTCSACGDSYGGEEIPKLATASGDADESGKTTLSDALAVLKYIGDASVTINLTNADIDANGSITLGDIIAILRIILTA